MHYLYQIQRLFVRCGGGAVIIKEMLNIATTINGKMSEVSATDMKNAE